MHPVLHQALTWWLRARPFDVDNVFMQEQGDTAGEPFRAKAHMIVHQHVKLPRSGGQSASKIDHPPGSCNPPVHRRREGDGQRGNDR